MSNENFINQLYYGDNLDVMSEKIQNKSIDLIYLDPPFNSNKNYNLIYSTATGQPVEENAIAFCDAWELTNDKLNDIKEFANELEVEDDNKSFADFWNAWVKALEYQNPKILAYLVFMARRLRLMKYKLKDTGSLFLHCDASASHYIKIILDGIFGHKNFRNEIIWQRTKNPKGSQFKEKKLGICTDSIFWYSKSENYKFDLSKIKVPLTKEEIEQKYHLKDDIGRYYSGPIECGPSMGDRPNLCYEYKGYKNQYPSGWRMTKENLIKLDELGNLGWSSTGRPFRKLRPEDDKGHPLYNLWTDINRLYKSKEKLGYPTQKPTDLLERIIKMCTDEGDIVLDPFCGCGTTLEAAQELKRKWIGIDICMLSTTLVEKRLVEKYPATLKKGKTYKVDGIPITMEQVKELINKADTNKNEGRYQFQYWAIEQVQGFASTKKSGDGGIDGAIYFYKEEKTLGKMLISVKSDKKLKASYIRDLIGTMENNKADMAGLISYAEPTKEMLFEASKAGYFKLNNGLFADFEFPRVQILTAEQILKGEKFALPYERLYREKITQDTFFKS